MQSQVSWFVLSFVLGGLVPANAHADEYYVSVDGSDTAEGTASSPWATVGHAIEAVPSSGGHTIWLGDGVYEERVQAEREFGDMVWIRAITPYRARLTRPDNPALDLGGRNLGFEGLEIEGNPDTGATGGLIYCDGASNTVFRNNIIHDSYDNDLVRLLGCSHTTFEQNVFYNQATGEEQFDINIGSQDTLFVGNIFFTDYEGSGRGAPDDLRQFILIKTSGGPDVITGNVTIRGNLFMHYVGSAEMIRCGADGEAYAECEHLTIENNLFLYDESASPPRGAVGVLGGRYVTVRANTFVGNSVDSVFAGSVSDAPLDSPPPASIRPEAVFFFNNVFAAPLGGMPQVIESPSDAIVGGGILNNLYWNAGSSIPSDSGDLFSASADSQAITLDPMLPDVGRVTLPRWTGSDFGGGSATIAEAFQTIVRAQGQPMAGSAVLGAADPANMPGYDILGNVRDADPDVGAFELGAEPGDAGVIDAGSRPDGGSGAPPVAVDGGQPPLGRDATADGSTSTGSISGCGCGISQRPSNSIGWSALLAVSLVLLRTGTRRRQRRREGPHELQKDRHLVR